MATIKKAQNGDAFQKLKKTEDSIYGAYRDLKAAKSAENAAYREKQRSLKTKFREAKDKMSKLPKQKSGGSVAKAQDGKFMKKMMRPKFNVAGPNTVRDKSGQLQNAVDPELLQGMKKGGVIKKAKDGMWMQKAAASIKKRGTEGKCTPITKPGCTGKAKTLAKTFKKIAKSNKKK